MDKKDHIEWTNEWHLIEGGRNLNDAYLERDVKDHPLIRFLDWILSKYCKLIDCLKNKN